MCVWLRCSKYADVRVCAAENTAESGLSEAVAAAVRACGSAVSVVAAATLAGRQKTANGEPISQVVGRVVKSPTYFFKDFQNFQLPFNTKGVTVYPCYYHVLMHPQIMNLVHSTPVHYLITLYKHNFLIYFT